MHTHTRVHHSAIHCRKRAHLTVSHLTHRLFCLYVSSGSEGAFLQEDTARLHTAALPAPPLPPPAPHNHLLHPHIPPYIPSYSPASVSSLPCPEIRSECPYSSHCPRKKKTPSGCPCGSKFSPVFDAFCYWMFYTVELLTEKSTIVSFLSDSTEI